MWHDRDTLSVVELIFYVPAILIAIFVCYKQGFKRSSGWFYTLILCLVRIISSSCQLYADGNPSTNLTETIFILGSVGLSPLLLATLGILNRFVDAINTRAATSFTNKHFRLIHIVLLLGVILSVVGGTSISLSANGSYHLPATSKAGIILYVVGFVTILFILLVSVPHRSMAPGRDRYIPFAIFIAVPFIAVRLLYSLLSVFAHSDLFRIGTGSVAVNAGMSIIEEFIAVGIYVALGLWLEKVQLAPKDDGNSAWVLNSQGHHGPSEQGYHGPSNGQGYQ